MRNALRKVAVATVVAMLGGGFANAETAAESQLDKQPDPRSQFSESITLKELGYNHSLELQGSESNFYIGFGSRLDEMVTDAKLDLRFTASPALLEVFSQLKLYLNNELVKVVPFKQEQLGESQEIRLSLDTRFLSDYNQLRLELIGHLNKECWNPDDPSIWAEISQASELHLSKRRLRLSNDLSLLPAPFFDQRDFTALNLPVVFGPDYRLETVKAAAMATSYFGSLALWRGAEFPLYVDQLPEQHALVMVTNDNRPAFLKDFPEVERPTLQVISHPDNPYVKLLLIQGRNDQDLVTAVQGLALGNALLSGPIATVNSVAQLKPRQPYDAPNWVRTDRPVKLGELVNDAQELQAQGRLPSPIQVSMQLPPDLFTWQSRGIPLDLRYRYSPPSEDGSGSKMSFAINDQFVEAFSLTTKGINGEAKTVRVPLMDGGFFDDGDRVRIPAFRVGTRNQLSFQFAFAATSDGACRTIPAGHYQAAVEADSTVDFTGFPHYIEMPNLHAFVTAGYPYTRMADLSSSIFLISPSPSQPEVETLLNLSGFMGASAGYPALSLQVTDQWDANNLKKKDVLVIGVNPALGDAMPEGDKLSLVMDSAKRMLKRPLRNVNEKFGRWSDKGETAAVESVEISADGAFAALVGLESPFTDKRSLIIFQAAHPDDLTMVTDAMRDSGKLPFMFGTVVTFRPDKVASFHVGDKYFVGNLPITTLIWYHFSKHPIVLAACALLLIVLLTIALWRALSVYSARRLREGDSNK